MRTILRLSAHLCKALGLNLSIAECLLRLSPARAGPLTRTPQRTTTPQNSQKPSASNLSKKDIFLFCSKALDFRVMQAEVERPFAAQLEMLNSLLAAIADTEEEVTSYVPSRKVCC